MLVIEKFMSIDNIDILSMGHDYSLGVDDL